MNSRRTFIHRSRTLLDLTCVKPRTSKASSVMRISSASSTPSMVSIPWATNAYFEGSVWMRHISERQLSWASSAIQYHHTYCVFQGMHSSTFGRRYGSYVQLQRRRSNHSYISFIAIVHSHLPGCCKRRKKQIDRSIGTRVSRILPERWHEISPADILRYRHQRFCPSDQSEFEWIYPRQRTDEFQQVQCE